MFVVYFFEDKNLLLHQYLNSAPTVGEDIKIKGRKGKVSSITRIDEKKVQVQVTIEKASKNKPVIADNQKKKKGK